MVKYKEYFTKMLNENKEAFDSFAKLHFEYSFNQESLQERFNSEGGRILDIVRDYENRLCANTERGMYNKYSAGLSEKFHEILKSHFPLIDHVGLTVENPTQPAYIPEIRPAFVIAEDEAESEPVQEIAEQDDFFLKKINL